MSTIARSTVLIASVMGVTPSVSADVLAVDVIAHVGQLAPNGEGATFNSFNPPFVNGNGQVGFTGQLSAGGPFVFHTDQVVWLNHWAPKGFTLTGTEATMGIGDNGEFIYSPNTNGNDSVWTHNGLLLAGEMPAPFMGKRWATANSRPRMTPDGVAWWIAGFSETQGGNSQGRILYACPDTSQPELSFPVLTTLNEFLVDGEMRTPTATGLGFAYDVSDNSEHAVTVLTLAGLPSASNLFIWRDNNLVVRKGHAVGDGTTWDTFRAVGINNSGQFVFSGTTAGGPSATQEYISRGGLILARRGDTLDGIELASNWATRWIAINNLGHIAHLWEGGSGLSLTGTLFVTLDANDAANSTMALVSAWEPLDTTGDGLADAVISDFKASAAIAPGLDFSDHPWVYVEVDLRDYLTATGEFGPAYEAIIRVPIPQTPGTCPADLNDSGAVDVQDLLILLSAWGPCKGECPADLNDSGAVDVQDLLILLSAWGPCPE